MDDVYFKFHINLESCAKRERSLPKPHLVEKAKFMTCPLQRRRKHGAASSAAGIPNKLSTNKVTHGKLVKYGD